MLVIKPDTLLVLASLVKENNEINNLELSCLSRVIKNNLSGSPIKSYYAVYPNADSKGQGWQNYFCCCDGVFKYFDCGLKRQDYTNLVLTEFVDSLVKEGIPQEKANKLISDVIDDFGNLLVKSKDPNKKTLVRLPSGSVNNK